MKSNTDAPSHPRQSVLVVSHPDGFIEVYAPPNIDARVYRVLASHSREAERIADDCIDLELPSRFRELHRADLLRATGTTRPRRPSSALQALVIRDAIASLNDLAPEPAGEVVAWTL